MRILLSLAFLVAAGAASAASAQDTVVRAQPFVDFLLPFIEAIVLGVLVPVATAFLIQKLRLDMEASHRDALQTSLTNAAGLLIQRGATVAGKASIDVRSPAMAEAIRYVQESAPDAVRKWGITPETIAEKIKAKIPQVEKPVPVPPSASVSL